MTRALYGWKAPANTAAAYLEERNIQARAERAYAAANQRMQDARDWLATYHAKPQPTRFNWSGRFAPITITQETDDEEAIEEAYRRAGAEAAEVSHGEGVGDALGKEGGAAGTPAASGGNVPGQLAAECADSPF